MLYPKSFSPELFNNPTSEYRGTPFWAWNCRLEKEELFRQIEIFKEMGLGGFHMHSRTGTVTEYLSEDFMDLIKACRDKAEDEEMLCWLYDEDRWPSGAAGGLVTKNTEYRARYLLFTPFSNEEVLSRPKEKDNRTSSASAGRNSRGSLLARYEVVLEDGYLKKYRILNEGEECREGTLWYAYREISDSSPWFNNQAYLDTLNPRAVEKFVQVTHEKYAGAVGESFGKSVPAIFTDEPQFTHKTSLGFAEEKKDIFLPFTDDLEESYQREYGDSFLASLPEIIWNLPGNAFSRARYNYHDHVAERFASAFADTIGSWCKEKGLMLTGHMMSEPTLQSQSNALGDCMRSYRSFQLPGIDMLCDWREYSTAKQAQSAAHQYGAPGVLSELYGVTNWDFDFRGHKLQGDWQAALGVTVRVQHLSWVSMGGEAKRDYPASISYQSPWYREYPLIENHFARVNTAMTAGKPSVQIGVIHPVESYWIHMGPLEQTGSLRRELEENFTHTVDWLIHDHLDFDFIGESLLPSQADYEEGKTPRIGQMSYKAILVPDCRRLRKTTVEFLKKFVKAGGRVIFSGNRPEEASELDSLRGVSSIPHTQSSLSQALKDVREVSIKDSSGQESDRHIYQFRRSGEEAFLFIAPSRLPEKGDLSRPENLKIAIKGHWDMEIMNTITGEIVPCPTATAGENTVLEKSFDNHDSLLLHLIPVSHSVEAHRSGAKAKPNALALEAKEISLPGEWDIELSEPNVLLLDRADWALNDGPWRGEKEILSLDNDMRAELGWNKRGNRICQPWAAEPFKGKPQKIRLKYRINSLVETAGVDLAVEEPEGMTITFNGEILSNNITGWYVDKSIKTIRLGTVPEGESILFVEKELIPQNNLESLFLLGDFGVRVTGTESELIPPVRKLRFGSWTTQGLPFYGGNVTYRSTINPETARNPGRYILQAGYFRAPLLKVKAGGKEIPLAFSPYTAEFTLETSSEFPLEITAFGSRINTFGQLHNCDRKYSWWGPDSWRTKGEAWADEYQLREAGILKRPRLSRLNSVGD